MTNKEEEEEKLHKREAPFCKHEKYCALKIEVRSKQKFLVGNILIYACSLPYLFLNNQITLGEE